jgi:putative transposase
MPNHVHLLLRQNTDQPICQFMHRLTVSYSMYFNKRYDRVGHLFQGRFKAVLIQRDEYLLHLSRYIHLNPLKFVNSAAKLETYTWSSYPEFLNMSEKKVCEKAIVLGQFNKSNTVLAYRRFINSFIPDEEQDKITNLIIESE